MAGILSRKKDGELSLVQARNAPTSGYWNYAGSFTYTPAGAVASMQLGNGRWESTIFNDRLQPTQIALGAVANGTDMLKLEYEYGVLNPGTGATEAGTNNGNVSKQKITVASVGATPGFVATQNYTYDSLNRLQIANENITPTGGSLQHSWRQHFKYDRYGNRNHVTTGDTPTTTLGSCPAAVCDPSVDPNTNKLNASGYTFDAAGNTVRDAENRKFTYDAENKQRKVESLSGETVTGTIGEYWYDGDGRRIKKRTYADNVLIEETIFVYDAMGKLVGEYSNEVASAQDAKVAYLTNDHLGSPRINTDASGSITSRHDYHPFGEEIAINRASGLGYADDSVRKQFTGYERDDESGLDFAQARYFSKKIGRFSSADEPLLDQYEDNPQSWNLYPYVRNNPLNLADPSGTQAGCPPEAPDGCYERDGKFYVKDENGEEVEYDPAPAFTVETRARAAEPAILGHVIRWLLRLLGRSPKVAPKPVPLTPRPPPLQAHPPVAVPLATKLAPAIPQVSDPKLANIVRDLYKGAKGPNPIGNGSTADAVRNELRTGLPTKNTFHSTKAHQYARALEKWIQKNPNADFRDKMVAHTLRDDLKAALAGN